MSSKPKKVFSEAENTPLDNCLSLTINTIQATQVLKSKFYNGLFTKGNINGAIPADILL